MSEPTRPEGLDPIAPPRQEPVTMLEQRLGVVLRDRATALTALTHKSYVNEHRGEPSGDNERLEFLGDAVIDLAVSHRLMERFPAAREGDLSKMRAAVVDEQGLAAMARATDLGVLLRLGRGEELTGGRQKASLLADAMEAVVAAIYLEHGLEGVLALVDRFLGDAFARAAAGTLDRDYKTQFQELAQSRLRLTPRYRVVAELGPDHAKIFEVELDVRGDVLGRAQGRSKKDAEQASARLALEALGRRFAAEAAAEAALAVAATEAAEATSRAAQASPAPVEPVEAAPSLPRARRGRVTGPARTRASGGAGGTAGRGARAKVKTRAGVKPRAKAKARGKVKA
jgi:ribonuclease-3